MFYSVKKSVKINGKAHVPCVCYECDDKKLKMMQELECRGLITIWDVRTYFQNGKPLSHVTTQKGKRGRKKKEEVVQEVVENTEEVTAVEVMDTVEEGF